MLVLFLSGYCSSTDSLIAEVSLVILFAQCKEMTRPLLIVCPEKLVSSLHIVLIPKNIVYYHWTSYCMVQLCGDLQMVNWFLFTGSSGNTLSSLLGPPSSSATAINQLHTSSSSQSNPANQPYVSANQRIITPSQSPAPSTQTVATSVPSTMTTTASSVPQVAVPTQIKVFFSVQKALKIRM